VLVAEKPALKFCHWYPFDITKLDDRQTLMLDQVIDLGAS
jgi:hypothetical protein